MGRSFFVAIIKTLIYNEGKQRGYYFCVIKEFIVIQRTLKPQTKNFKMQSRAMLAISLLLTFTMAHICLRMKKDILLFMKPMKP